MSKVIWQKAASHRRLVTPCGGLCIRRPRSRWAGTFASGGRQTLHNAVIAYLATLKWGRPMSLQKCPFPWEIWIPCNIWFIGSYKSVSQTVSRSVHPFCTAHLCARHTHTQTDKQITLRATSVAIGRIHAPHPGDAA